MCVKHVSTHVVITNRKRVFLHTTATYFKAQVYACMLASEAFRRSLGISESAISFCTSRLFVQRNAAPFCGALGNWKGWLEFFPLGVLFRHSASPNGDLSHFVTVSDVFVIVQIR